MSNHPAGPLESKAGGRTGRNRCLALAWAAVILGAAAKACFAFLTILAAEGRGPLNGDALIYLTVGRGVLNGLPIYSGLFESKPPGVFYLAAASLWLGGGTALMRAVQAANLLSLPVSISVAAWLARRDRAMAASAFLFGVLLALWAQGNSGGLQTEVFGLLPAAVYAANVSHPGRSGSRTVLSAACILLAVCFREPYILGFLAAALLSADDAADLFASFVWPALLAAAAAAVVLLLTGLLGPYALDYLPGMLAHRVGHSGVALPLRSLWVQLLFSSLTTYSPVPLLGYVVGVLWVFTAVRGSPSRQLTALAGAAAAGGALAMAEYFTLFTLFGAAAPAGLSPWAVLTDAGFWPISLAYAAGSALLVALLAFVGREHPPSLWRLGCSLLALSVASQAILIGGNARNYLLYLTPALVVLFLEFARRARGGFLPGAVTLLLCVMVFMQGPARPDAVSLGLRSQARAASASLDRLMDACGLCRYVFAGEYPVFAFARHSPVGPIFAAYYHDYLGLDHPLYRRTFEEIRRDGDLLVQPKVPPFRYPAPREVLAMFTNTAPPCAKGIPPPPGYVVRFRAR